MSDLATTLPPEYSRHELGSGRITRTASGWRLAIGPTLPQHYSNAQIDDYAQLRRANFAWRPPLTLTVRARFSHGVDQLQGTAGFGFWNAPAGSPKERLPALPRAVWFFFNSRTAPLRLARETPGYGWRAATIDAGRWPVRLLLPSAPLVWPLLRWRWCYERIWPLAQSLAGVREAMVSVDPTEWHTYELHWQPDYARFCVDGEMILQAPRPTTKPLGLVVWIDNQALLVQPGSRLRSFLLATPHEQWLELASLRIAT